VGLPRDEPYLAYIAHSCRGEYVTPRLFAIHLNIISPDSHDTPTITTSPHSISTKVRCVEDTTLWLSEHEHGTSILSMTTKVVGIINCTPDSFSDGQEKVSTSDLIDRAYRLLDEGADILDIGGDSTRPGSTCPGIEEEWRRISPLVSEFAPRVPVSVDTHHSEVARRAIECGASFINDISGTRSPEMLSTIAKSSASYIFMCNPHGGAHIFGEGLSLDTAVSEVSAWIRETIHVCLDAGIQETKLIPDPGMGAFLSVEPRVSWIIAEHFGELPLPAGGILLGCSRKGFLNLLGDMAMETKDILSAQIGAAAVRQVSRAVPTYLRVHNVAAQRKALTESAPTFPDWRARSKG